MSQETYTGRVSITSQAQMESKSTPAYNTCTWSAIQRSHLGNGIFKAIIKVNFHCNLNRTDFHHISRNWESHDMVRLQIKTSWITFKMTHLIQKDVTCRNLVVKNWRDVLKVDVPKSNKYLNKKISLLTWEVVGDMCNAVVRKKLTASNSVDWNTLPSHMHI